MKRRLSAFALALTLLARPAGAADAPLPSALGYKPQDELERSLWLEMDEQERELKNSKFVVRDPALNAYVRGVLCRTVGEDRCQSARIYIVRTPQFNANMAPNGMMQVWTGLLLRMRNEAQLAAVLGHEFGHFERQHSLKQFKSIRSKADAMAWLSFLPYGAGLIGQVALLGSVFSFSRDMEREADELSVTYLAQSPYATDQANRIWEQLRAEQDATAAARGTKSAKDKNGGFFATHPNTAERVAYLREAATQKPHPEGRNFDAEYRQALVSWWPSLIDDQVKLNDFGGTSFLLEKLAADGWTPDLNFARGELYRARGREGDFAAAATHYRAAIDSGSVLPECWRGLGMAMLRNGQQAEGQAALQKYLELKPDAGDRSIIAMMAGGLA